MKKDRGTAADTQGVLEEIQERLSALTPEKFSAPPTEREPDAHFVCIATDRIKRLQTLREALVNQCKTLALTGLNASKRAKSRFFSVGPAAIVKEMETPGSQTFQLLETMKRTSYELQQADSFFEIVDRIFWLEVRRMHPDLSEHANICIYADWSLCWKEKAEDVDDIMADSNLLAELGSRITRRQLH